MGAPVFFHWARKGLSSKNNRIDIIDKTEKYKGKNSIKKCWQDADIQRWDRVGVGGGGGRAARAPLGRDSSYANYDQCSDDRNVTTCSESTKCQNRR